MQQTSPFVLRDEPRIPKCVYERSPTAGTVFCFHGVECDKLFHSGLALHCITLRRVAARDCETICFVPVHVVEAVGQE